MKFVNDVKHNMVCQQLNMLSYIKNIIYSSGNLNGISQWRDRKRLHEFMENIHNDGYLLTKKDFEFLVSLYQKYKK
jgi:hypothetical protein